MNREEYKGVYVYAQQVDNKVSNIALELLGNGHEPLRCRGHAVVDLRREDIDIG